jgi:hypothetical protein
MWAPSFVSLHCDYIEGLPLIPFHILKGVLVALILLYFNKNSNLTFLIDNNYHHHMLRIMR